jgi:hypothetical protein
MKGGIKLLPSVDISTRATWIMLNEQHSMACTSTIVLGCKIPHELDALKWKAIGTRYFIHCSILPLSSHHPHTIVTPFQSVSFKNPKAFLFNLVWQHYGDLWSYLFLMRVRLSFSFIVYLINWWLTNRPFNEVLEPSVAFQAANVRIKVSQCRTIYDLWLDRNYTNTSCCMRPGGPMYVYVCCYNYNPTRDCQINDGTRRNCACTVYVTLFNPISPDTAA